MKGLGGKVHDPYVRERGVVHLQDKQGNDLQEPPKEDLTGDSTSQAFSPCLLPLLEIWRWQHRKTGALVFSWTLSGSGYFMELHS